MSVTDLYPIAVLIDELKSDEAQFRLNSMQRLTNIASALGEERTRNELVPFLTESSIDDDDEVLLVLAAKLGEFVNYVGGPSHAHILLKPLEALVMVEEAAVREKALISICRVVSNLSNNDIVQHFYPILRRIATIDFFTSRISACDLFAPTYKSVDEAMQLEYRGLFGQLCRDETPMVRRAAAMALGVFARTCMTCDTQEQEESDGIVVLGGKLFNLNQIAKSETGAATGKTGTTTNNANTTQNTAAANVNAAAKMIAAMNFGGATEKRPPFITDDSDSLAEKSLQNTQGDQEKDGSESSNDPFSTSFSSSSSLNHIPLRKRIIPSEKLNKMLRTEIMPLFLHLAEDEQDSVRLLAVTNCVHLALLMPIDKCPQIIVPKTLQLASDRSWRVRWKVADSFCDLCKVMGPELANKEMLETFKKLLDDSEAEVRTAAALNLTKVCSELSSSSVKCHLLPSIKHLTTDTRAGSEHVRSALAKVVLGLAPIFGKEDTIEHLLEMFLTLLKDQNSEVRLNIISKLSDLNQVIGVDLLSQSLLPAVVDLAEDKQWRVRLAIIDYIPLLAEQLGVKFFDEKLGMLCMTWLGDSVYSIRQAATANLSKLTRIFGVEWSKKNIVPKVSNLLNHSNYLYRMTALFCINVLADSISRMKTDETTITDALLPMVIKHASDPVPNIRINVAKSLGLMIAHVDTNTTQGRVKKTLTTLTSDSDVDVAYFARQALEGIKAK